MPVSVANLADVLAVDAFSIAAIPVHLITREALQVYLKHIKPDGVIVFQATNRYIEIMPVVKRHANELGMEAVLVSDVPGTTRDAIDSLVDRGGGE